MTATKPAMSRQRAWQLERVKAGQCQCCGQPREHYPGFCDACQIRNRIGSRKRSGCKAWEPGHQGRPPIVKA